MKKFAVIVAGGSGTRMNNPTPKQFLLIGQKPVIYYTVQRFLEAIPDISIILVLPASHIDTGKAIIHTYFPQADISITEGGSTRFESVRNGLSLVQQDGMIFVHDAVRCLLSTALILRCYEEALANGSAIPVVPVKDSVRMLTETGNKPVDRNTLKLVQTPQVFRGNILLPAFQAPYRDAFTDEATVVEAMGQPVHLVEGEEQNIKITTVADLEAARRMLASS